MPQRNVIEETFRAITPSRRRGIPNTPLLSASFDSAGTDLNTSLSQAALEISQLRSAWQQQATLIADNTTAIRSGGSGSAQSGGTGQSKGSVAGQIASSVFGGALSVLSPVAKGILGLFGLGGDDSAPPPLPVYVAPPPVSISGVVRSTNASEQTTPVQPSVPVAPAAQQQTETQAPSASQITVNINALDSQSFLDRSHDIASAVRLAMLNLHPINDVVADL